MKFTKNLAAFMLVLVMVCALVPVVASAEYNMTASTTPLEVADNVFHTTYKVTSGENGNVVDTQILTFDTDDGYLPLVYVCNAGWGSTLKTQYEKASQERWGYEPVAIINGSFFNIKDNKQTN